MTCNLGSSKWSSAALLPVLFSFLLCAGCSRDFNDEMAEIKAEEKPMKLDGEQLVLTGAQVDCGVQQELWEKPSQVGERSIARLLPKGRDLKFYDDVVVHEPGV